MLPELVHQAVATFARIYPGISDFSNAVMRHINTASAHKLLGLHKGKQAAKVASAAIAPAPSTDGALPTAADSTTESHDALDKTGHGVLNTASNVMLTAGVNGVVKRDVAPVLDDLFMPANISQSCDHFIYNSFVYSAPVLSSGLVKLAGYYSLSVPLSVGTMYVSHAGLPYDTSSMMQAGKKLVVPLFTSKIITKALSFCGAMHPHAKTAITVGIVGASFLTKSESDSHNKDLSEVLSNIVADNADPLSVATLTFMTVTGLGVVTATAPAVAVSAVVGLAISSAHTAYKEEITPSSMKIYPKL